MASIRPIPQLVALLVALGGCTLATTTDPSKTSDPNGHAGAKVSDGPFRVTTFAGSTMGYEDGPAASAKFFWPSAIAFDAAGSALVTDRANGHLRKITSDGQVTTLTPVTPAAFKNPDSLAIASSGDVYVADTQNHVIKKVTNSGEVSVFAGTGVVGKADGAVDAATFQLPSTLAVAPDGAVYVSDHSGKIRKIADGQVTTLEASFFSPQGIAYSNGRLYVCDNVEQIVSYVDLATGKKTELAGTVYGRGYQDGTGKDARFDGPLGIAVDGAGTVFVGDAGNRRIRRVSAEGKVTTIAGTGESGLVDEVAGLEAKFSDLRGMAIDASGNLYVCDNWNQRIRKLSPTAP